MAGAAASFALLGAWFLLYGVRAGPFPPFDLADLIIRHTPGVLATWAIETFEHQAQPALAGATIVAFVTFWALGGALLRRWPARVSGITFGIAQAPISISVVHAAQPRDTAGLIWLSLLLTSTLALAGAAAGHWLALLGDDARRRSEEPPSPEWLATIGTSTRRELLSRMLAIGAAGGVGGALAGGLLRQAAVNEPLTAAGTPLPSVRELAASTGIPNVVSPGLVITAAPLQEQTAPPSGSRSRVTSNRDFYVVDISFRKPVIPEIDWRLRVYGLVDRELTLTYADLLAEPAIDQYGTLMCISYTHANDLISSTLWTGVPLHQILDRAGVMANVVDVVCRGPGGYSDSIPLADAVSSRTILAYGMNGVTLPREHGFPCRLYVPGLYGEKNVKWLREIELVDYEYKGYWQERGWTDIAVIKTMSAFDTPRGNVDSSRAGDVPTGGVAFAGTRGVQMVEVRVDDGDWQRAEVEAYDPALLWQRWRFAWQPERGPHTLAVRCTDGGGDIQTSDARDPHPDGMTGLHVVEVYVV
ncbi:MAG TPA: molybdopterin-dependent oxidoreductase [Thermomicrobiales bacterium]|nr:molybdopterin-dependent oxidoreductase [Thermomicrobiales bacterium]